ncbi:MAG: PEP-CTERM sorting domain-containing protein [Opitutales bacterium]|nr:PEP-CTERM sorting domain-containing protein [Opitutales bacterium]
MKTSQHTQKPGKITKALPFLSIVGFCGAFTAAQASLLVYEGFDYGTGSVTGGNGTTLSVDGSAMNGGSGWSGAWVGRNAETNFGNIVSGSLSYGDLPTSGNRIQLGSFRDISRDFDSALGEGTHYFSVLLDIGDSTDNERTRFRITQDGSQDNLFEVGFGFSGSDPAELVYRTGGDTPVGGAATGISGTNLFVGKFDMSAGGVMSNISIWLNPTDLTSESANTLTLDLDSASIGGGAGGVRLTRTGGTESGVFDEVRFGTTWDAVAIPEPSTYGAIFGLSALALVAFRRRMRKDSD